MSIAEVRDLVQEQWSARLLADLPIIPFDDLLPRIKAAEDAEQGHYRFSADCFMYFNHADPRGIVHSYVVCWEFPHKTIPIDALWGDWPTIRCWLHPMGDMTRMCVATHGLANAGALIHSFQTTVIPKVLECNGVSS